MYEESSLGTEFIVAEKQIEHESTYTLIGLLNTVVLGNSRGGFLKCLGKFLGRWK